MCRLQWMDCVLKDAAFKNLIKTDLNMDFDCNYNLRL